MATHQRIQYIAEGYLEDSSLLLKEFVDLGTVEFSEFASLWRKHHFSLIFMGRPDHAETCEFVNEVFRITSQYLYSPLFHQQVGAVYTMYALFRNQIAEPNIKIRIELNHWKVIKSLREEAILKNYKTLHYVIDYLIKHAFLYVANQNLKGPLIGNTPKSSKYDECICNMKSSYKSDLMKYSFNSNLPVLRDLQMQYILEKRNMGASRITLSENCEIYEEAMKELHEIINPNTKTVDNVGDRRAKIKADSFMRKCKNRFGIASDDEVEIEDEEDLNYTPEKKKIVCKPRPRKTIPKEERRVGRPRKHPKKIKEEPKTPPEVKSDDEVDITHLLEQQMDLYRPPIQFETRKLRTKRDPYYQASPRRESTDSDTDISE